MLSKFVDFKSVFASQTGLFLLFSNILVLILALFYTLGFAIILVTYFVQVLIIGFFHYSKSYLFNKNMVFNDPAYERKINPEWLKIKMSDKERNGLLNKMAKEEEMQKAVKIETNVDFGGIGGLFIVICFLTFLLFVIFWFFIGAAFFIGFVSLVEAQTKIQLFGSLEGVIAFIVSIIILFINHLFSFIKYLNGEKETFKASSAVFMGRVKSIILIIIIGTLSIVIFSEMGLISTQLNIMLILIFSIIKIYFDMNAHLVQHSLKSILAK